MTFEEKFDKIIAVRIGDRTVFVPIHLKLASEAMQTSSSNSAYRQKATGILSDLVLQKLGSDIDFRIPSNSDGILKISIT